MILGFFLLIWFTGSAIVLMITSTKLFTQGDPCTVRLLGLSNAVIYFAEPLIFQQDC